MSEKDSGSVLAGLRLLTEWTGKITESQVRTLNMWPLVMIKGLDSHTIRLNLDQRSVEFALKMKGKKPIKDLTSLTRIEMGVWALLGDTWYTAFRAEGRVVYRGSRRKEFEIGNQSTDQERSGPEPERKGSLPKVPRGRKAKSCRKHGR